ncbi:MAG: LysM peptidoglycan-binding domain-containing protein [Oligoflexales bacterium]|nr:LysM peptidoglycan-binding domain-containing protein [Oligoflexales bacterium]
MRLRLLSPKAWLSLLLMLQLTQWGCSSSSEEGDELENSDAEEAAEVDGEEGDEGVENEEGEVEEGAESEEGETEEGAESEEGADESMDEDSEATEEDAGEDLTNASQGEESEADLQQIISELNENSAGNEAYAANQAPMSQGAANSQNMVNLATTPAAEAVPMNSAMPANPEVPMSNSMPAESVPMAAPVAVSGSFLPEMGSKMPYIVQKGETLAKISAKIYGSEDKWSDIQTLSSIENADRIFPGDVVYYQLNEQTMAFAQTYESAPRKEVTVAAGETLSTIADRVYGNAKAWKFIWRQNGNIDNPDLLSVGQIVYYVEYKDGELASIKAPAKKYDLSSKSVFVKSVKKIS